MAKPMYVKHSVVAAGTASTTIVPANSMRRYVLLINDSDAVVYLAVDGKVAAMNSGVRLNSNGGSFEFGPDANGLCYTGDVYGISTAGSKNILVTEAVNYES